MIKKTSKFVLSLLLGSILAKDVILEPAADSDGEPIAIIWIHGMECKSEAYETLAQDVQTSA